MLAYFHDFDTIDNFEFSINRCPILTEWCTAQGEPVGWAAKEEQQLVHYTKPQSGIS